ncbi:MAG: AraC family transcriptional regulator [Clostridia bacterium]|nr:AraC family transcriptional regulator [Clostridia bacterium]NCC43057.1 AraC family transcriptional regulator [Clostridia bacterium]
MFPSTHETIYYPSDIDILFQINEIQLRGEHAAPHWHNSLEIIYVLEGTEECILGQSNHYILAPGNFLVINSREIHHIQVPAQAKEMLIQIPYPFLRRYIPNIEHLRFNCAYVKDRQSITDQYLSASEHPSDSGHYVAPEHQTTDDIHHLSKILYHLGTLYPLKNTARVLRFYSLIFDLLCCLTSSFGEEISPTEKEKSVKYMQRLGQITSYVRDHYAEDITLNKISEEVSLNPDYFTRFFKKYMGMTFLDYVNTIRLEHISKDLMETDLSVQSLIEMHGFTNYKLFMKMYKSRFHCTPGEMRKKN